MTHSNALAVKRSRIAALGAATLGVVTAATMASVPTANATCFSAFGIGSGGQCTSTLTSIAIAIGTNAEAHAEGILGAAMTFGDNSSAATVAGALSNLAVTFGNTNLTSAGGIGSLAFVANGINQTVLAGVGGLTSGNFANFAASLTSPEATETIASGIANTSINFVGSGLVAGNGVGLTTVNFVGINNNLNNAGVLNNITNISGDNNNITNNVGKGGIGNFGFNLIGTDNVIRTSGSFAIAGAIGSQGQTVNQDGFGVNLSLGKRVLHSAGATNAAASKSPKPAAARNPGGSHRGD